MSFADVVRLASKYTVAQCWSGMILPFATKPENDQRARIPLSSRSSNGFRCYSFRCRAWRNRSEVNLLVGRDIQREFGQEPQVTLMMPILAGTDVLRRWVNLSITTLVSTIRQRYLWQTLSIPDKLIYQYFELANRCSKKELLEIKKSLDNPKTNPLILNVLLHAHLFRCIIHRKRQLVPKRNSIDICREKYSG